MRTLLFLAVFVLATQAHIPEVNELYRTFINTIPTPNDEAKVKIMNNGLDCINWVTNFIVSSAQDIKSKDIVGTIGHAISSIQVFEEVVFPKCLQTHQDLLNHLEHYNFKYYDKYQSRSKWTVYVATGYQTLAKAIMEALKGKFDSAAKDFALYYSSAFYLVDFEIPDVLELDPSKYVPMDEQKAIPQFLRGLLTGLDISGLDHMNSTSECTLDILTSIIAITSGPVSPNTSEFESLLKILMAVNNSLDKCKKLGNIDTAMINKLQQNLAPSILRVLTNYFLNAPTVAASDVNMNVYLNEGQYELAGKSFALKLRTLFNGVLF